ncbi:flagellar hook-associated protein FlgK [Sulfitobacter sp.]|uniref:flagellar hook-associated protein FlgK n=1 Tax=Sulfitobacter sp. TaxID=1903071 RepID=UPI00356AB030
MSITGALSNAMQGLQAAGRGSEVIAANLSNVLTPGYGLRVLDLSSNATSSSGGVKVDGISRQVNESLIQDKRLAEAGNANASVIHSLYSTIENMIGAPDEPSSLTAQLATLETDLLTAASRPDAPERLSTAVASARNLANSFVKASNTLQDARSDADRTIGTQVDRLNSALVQVKALNTQITKSQVQGNLNHALLDQRQVLIDEISTLVPVRTIPRDNGQVALYSTGGVVLLDGSAAQVGFQRSNTITPYLTKENGALSGITVNGYPVTTKSDHGGLSGGSIAAQFAIRDDIAVNAQTQLDALARDLIVRFQDPAIDTTLGANDPGLFTDENAAFDPADEIGIAQRIAVNTAVDPQKGGEPWRLRDGISAAAPGDVGDGTLLNRLMDALKDGRPAASGMFSGGSYSAIDLTTTLTSHFGAKRNEAENSLSFSAAQVSELTERLLGDGVDSDQELQKLLLVEQAFAANARVIQTVDELMQTLLRI